jgi:hypothetical protein
MEKISHKTILVVDIHNPLILNRFVRKSIIIYFHMIKNGGCSLRCTNFVMQRTFRKLIFNSCGMKFVNLMGEEFVSIAVYTFPSIGT